MLWKKVKDEDVVIDNMLVEEVKDKNKKFNL